VLQEALAVDRERRRVGDPAPLAARGFLALGLGLLALGGLLELGLELLVLGLLGLDVLALELVLLELLALELLGLVLLELLALELVALELLLALLELLGLELLLGLVLASFSSFSFFSSFSSLSAFSGFSLASFSSFWFFSSRSSLSFSGSSSSRLTFSIGLAACGSGSAGGSDSGPDPLLPDIVRSLDPTMASANPPRAAAGESRTVHWFSGQSATTRAQPPLARSSFTGSASTWKP
jgi:hypothetical protein